MTEPSVCTTILAARQDLSHIALDPLIIGGRDADGAPPGCRRWGEASGGGPLAPVGRPDHTQLANREPNPMRTPLHPATPRSASGGLLVFERAEHLGMLTAHLAHATRNLLAAIGGVADIANDPESAQGDRAALRIIGEAVERGVDLCDGMLDYAQCDASTPGAVPVDAWIAGLAPLLRGLLFRRGELRLLLDAAGAEARIDRTAQTTVLMELVANASRALGARGLVTIATTRSDLGHNGGLRRGLRVTVSDTGHGMDAATLGRALEPGFTTRPDGTGLGLAAVARAVSADGGRTWVTSCLGRGTEVEIWLPLVEEPFDGKGRRGREERT